MSHRIVYIRIGSPASSRTGVWLGILVFSVCLFLALFIVQALTFHFLDANVPRLRCVPIDGYSLLSLLVLAPVSETLIWQAAVIEIFFALSRNVRIAGMISVIAFAAVHVFPADWRGAAPGLIGGFFLTLIYIHMRRVSIRTAAVSTMIVHGSTNALTVLGLSLSC